MGIDGLQFDGVLFLCGGVEGQVDFGGIGEADAVDGVVLLVESKLQFFHALIILLLYSYYTLIIFYVHFIEYLYSMVDTLV